MGVIRSCTRPITIAATNVTQMERSCAISAAASGYNASAPAGITPRSHAEVAAFFTGLELVPPGVGPLGPLGPLGPSALAAGAPRAGLLPSHAALARKP